MGLAVDTIVVDVNNPGATFTAAAVIAGNGDSLTVRNFAQSAQAKLTHVVRRHNTSGAVRVTSPLLHDNVTGITFYTNETPSLFMMPDFTGQPVYPGDTLTVQNTGDTTHHCTTGLTIAYTDLPGASANLFGWGDISGAIKNVKPITIAVTCSGTVGAWADTLITATENQLHAGSYYAVLGAFSDTAIGLIAFKGQSTSNLRNACPGATTPEDTSDFWIMQNRNMGVPTIPVFNGQDRGAHYVSTVDNAASTTANITLVLAELAGTGWSR